MIAASALIDKFRQALDEKWGYIWGQSGAVWTQAKQDAATREMTVKYGSRWIGKRVADCSGLFVWAFKQLGGSIYHGSNTIWRQYCSAQGTLKAGQFLRPGTALFKVDGSGDRYHIGLYVGDDTVIEAKGTQYGVVSSRVGEWDEWAELKGVTYAGDSGISVTLAKGAKGEAVRELQTNLLMLGYSLPKYGADGSFGTETEAAVKAFQADNGLAVDGKYGEKTHAVLVGALANFGPSVSQPEQPDGSEENHAAATVVLVSDGGKVNIRKGNGTSFARIALVAPGSTYAHVATAANGWHAVVIGSQVGWVSGDYSRII